MNHLADSASLYLRQHAGNPVDWHPWNDAALALARESGKPILLSIGYSACHWCHVMAHESFEDADTAALMNEHFVNIKVDREERPDLDRLYQLAHQLLTRRGGGWPLTLFLDPDDLAPFFAGTYFPPAPRYGMPSFRELMLKVSQWYGQNRETARRQNAQLAGAIAQLQQAEPGALPEPAALIETLASQLFARFDALNGGFGGAPKFPQGPLLSLVTGLALDHDDAGARTMLQKTLESMALRGLRDPLDGGFYRYCVDGDWTIPHFEKMLYDNALLLPVFARMASASGDALFEQAAEGIAGWLQRDMQQAGGGLYASIDADADGVEGGFHTWSRDEVQALLGEGYQPFAAQFGLDDPPNFEGHAWHLVQRGRSTHDFSDALAALRTTRATRIPPTTDTKILTAWNALAISGLVQASMALSRPDWLDLARFQLDFLREHAWRDGRLFAVVSGVQASHPAYLDDHAFTIQACLQILEARWDGTLLAFATQLADILLDLFEDHEAGGFWFSARNREVPMSRLRHAQDDATPSGYAVAALALQRLGALTLEPRYAESARRALEAAAGELDRQPIAHASLAHAALQLLQPHRQVIIHGEDEAETRRWKAAMAGFDRVNCYRLPPGEHPPGITGGGQLPGPASALVCVGTRCLAPATSVEELKEQLETA